MTEIEELRAELERYRVAYYNLDPLVSDDVYDAKLERLRTLSPDDIEVKAVGAAPPKLSVWEKVKHKIAMGSLSKVNTSEEFAEWVTKTGQEAFLFTLKIDGSSMELVYEHGKLVRCVTRGDGVVGEDVTENIRKVPDIPAEIPIPEEVTVRGEIVMTKEVFKRLYSEEYANPRNTAAGKVRDRKGGGSDCLNLSFVAFTLMSASAPPKESLRFKVLKKMGFTVPEYGVGTAQEAEAFHQALANGGRERIPYEIDGTVMRVEDIGAQEALGELNMRPRGQRAYKFESAKGVTKVLDVKWQVGPTGRVTPVANVEPVLIGGVTITSISLHNLSMFRALQLFRGCEVLVERRNDVIPYVAKNLSLEAT
jgi:DNA ligase (NAD+)